MVTLQRVLNATSTALASLSAPTVPTILRNAGGEFTCTSSKTNHLDSNTQSERGKREGEARAFFSGSFWIIGTTWIFTCSVWICVVYFFLKRSYT